MVDDDTFVNAALLAYGTPLRLILVEIYIFTYLHIFSLTILKELREKPIVMGQLNGGLFMVYS